MLTIQEIMEVIPHRPPFLLIDRILEFDATHAVGLKQISINEPFFVGHFPQEPVMPGVLIIEAMAQVGAFAVLYQPAFRGKIAYFAGIDNVRFKRKVIPGDTLRLEVTLEKLRSRVGKAKGVAYVDGNLAAEGDLTFVIDSPPER